jgi:phenylacetyl-CoA:acceptor oxidoreductase subunit 2
MKQFVQSRLQRYWDIRAAANFSFGGTGSGLIVAAVVAHAAGIETQVAAAVGLALVGLGLFCVWLEIGKPWRSINVIFHPQTSWMSREALVAPFLLASGAAALWLDSGMIFLVGIFAALFLFCQARILLASRGIPAWSQKEIVPLILLTGVAEGTAVFILITGGGAHTIGGLIVLAILREVAREFYRRALVARKAPNGTLAWLHSGEEKIFLGARLAAIAVLGAVAFGLLGGGAAFLAALLVLLTGWILKIGIVIRGAFQRGFIIEHTPARGRGPTEVVIPS